MSDELYLTSCRDFWSTPPGVTVNWMQFAAKSTKYFRSDPSTPNALSSLLLENVDVGMRDDNLFLNLELAERQKILPFVTLHSCKEWIHFRIYALLTVLDSDCCLQSFAIRFETDEGEPDSGSGSGAHDFCHAQLCSGIGKHLKEVTRLWVPESQPSIPLDTDNQIGLVLCMLTSLYGGRHVRSKFNRSGDSWLLNHLNGIRALRNPKSSA